jgi:hypothetical protein
MDAPSSTRGWQKSSVLWRFLPVKSLYAGTVINLKGQVAAGLATALCVISWNASAKELSRQYCYRVSVRLSNQAEAPADLLRDGEGATSTIFAGIHVQLTWVHLTWRDQTRHQSMAVSGCIDEPATHDITLEIVRHAPAGASGAALAMAMPYADDGVRAVIFYDRVEPLLQLHHAPQATVLGYVLAHEIAHILQGTARHSETGVMRARWTENDFQQMRIRMLTFTSEDVLLIRQRLAHCDTSATWRRD